MPTGEHPMAITEKTTLPLGVVAAVILACVGGIGGASVAQYRIGEQEKTTDKHEVRIDAGATVNQMQDLRIQRVEDAVVRTKDDVKEILEAVKEQGRKLDRMSGVRNAGGSPR